MEMSYTIGIILNLIFFNLLHLNKKIKLIIYLSVLFLFIANIYLYNNTLIFNLLTILFVIDVKNYSNEITKSKSKIKLYNLMSSISKSLVLGFVAPVFLILLLGNNVAFLFSILYKINKKFKFRIINCIINLIAILPCFITEIFVYIVIVIRNKTGKINFKGDFIYNSLFNPLLNLSIMSAYMESVNFYYHYKYSNKDSLKYYGNYKYKIDTLCVKDYLSITYGIAFILFAIFLFLLNYIS